MNGYPVFLPALPRGTRKQLKQTLPSGVELWRAAGWGGNGFGDWSQWEAVAGNRVVAFWSSDQRGVFVGARRFGFLRFGEWKQRIRNLDPKEL